AGRLEGARRRFRRRAAVDRGAEEKRRRGEIPRRVHRRHEALGSGRAARREARRQGSDRRAAGGLKVSIVVPAFNEERLLPATLRHLNAGLRVIERRGGSGELIVCDNNSTDRTADLARAAGAAVVFEPVNQIARARHPRAEGASRGWLLFGEADCAPGPELFEDVLGAIESGRCVGGGCTIAMAGAPPVLRFWVGAWNAFSRIARWAAGAFLFCEAAAFRAAGGFSEEL